MKLTKNSSVLIATFSPWIKGKRLPINGNLEPMRDFFLPRVRKFTIIDQPYPGSDFVIPVVERYESGKQIDRSPIHGLELFKYLLLKFNYGGTHIVFKIRDVLSCFFVGMVQHFDFFIGFEAINTLAGVILRAFGKVRYVIYYVSDYSPQRYRARWFNSLYLRLDRLAAQHSDVIWDVSKAMQPARIKAGLDVKRSAPVLHIPNALYKEQLILAPLTKIKKHSLVFLGTLWEDNGPFIDFEAMPIMLKKIPDATLHIIGGGNEDRTRLSRLVRALDIQKSVTFGDFISDRLIVSKTIQSYAIGLAPYKHILGSARLYGDATKIRAYMASGLPTITTAVPPLGKEIVQKGAGIIVSDTPDGIAQGVLNILNNRNKWKKMRLSALAFAKDNVWDKEYTRAFRLMEKL